MNRQQPVFYLSFAVVAALLIVSAVAMPRFLAYGPGVMALVFSGLFVFGCKERLAWPVDALKLLLPALALGGLSALWALDPGEVMERTGKLAPVMLAGALLIALVRALPMDRLRPYLWVISGGVLTASLLIGIDLVFDSPLYRLVRGGFDGNVPDAVYNRGAVSVVLCLFPAAALLKARLGCKKALALLVPVVGGMLLLVESQSAQLALVAGLIVAAAFPYNCRVAWYGLAAAIAGYILLAPFAAIWAFDQFAVSVDNMPLLGEGGGYAGARMEIWDYVSRYVLESPLLGYGLEACRIITDFDSAQLYQQGTSILHPHNFALQLWIEMGVAGALVGAGFFVYLLHVLRTRLSAEQARIALPTLIAGLSVGSTGYGMWQGWWVGLLFLAAALCIFAVRERGAAASEAAVSS